MGRLRDGLRDGILAAMFIVVMAAVIVGWHIIVFRFLYFVLGKFLFDDLSKLLSLALVVVIYKGENFLLNYYRNYCEDAKERKKRCIVE